VVNVERAEFVIRTEALSGIVWPVTVGANRQLLVFVAWVFGTLDGESVNCRHVCSSREGAAVWAKMIVGALSAGWKPPAVWRLRHEIGTRADR
jgi:hypothetical protein